MTETTKETKTTKKGFKKPKSKTKAQVVEENTLLQNNLQAIKGQLNQVMQIVFQQNNLVQRHSKELNVLTELLRSTEASSEVVEASSTVMIDYIGYLLNDDGTEGESIDGFQALGYTVTLGRGNLIKDFEDNLIGLTTGNTSQFTVTFPDDYKEELKGKKALFKVEVVKILKDKTSGEVMEMVDEHFKTKQAEQQAAQEVKTEESQSEA